MLLITSTAIKIMNIIRVFSDAGSPATTAPIVKVNIEVSEAVRDKLIINRINS